MDTQFPFPTPNPDYPRERPDPDSTLSLLLPLLILLSTLLSLLLLFLLFLILLRRKQRQQAILLRDDENEVIDVGREEEELERGIGAGGEGRLAREEEVWLESNSRIEREAYLRAKTFQIQYPPNSLPTDITLSQFLTIQEKGVSAWSFEPDYESNLPILVQSRTDIHFLEEFADSELYPCNVQSNLPLPKINEVYYWECKIFDIGEGTEIGIGMATKPYPSFRLPGQSRYSVGYFSNSGSISHSYPFLSRPYGPPLQSGDVLGVGYRTRTGTMFFTRNGKNLSEAYTGLSRPATLNLFPTIGATGPCRIEVNFGGSGFVFIEANVKKWGLAPGTGTLAPPPAYGSERGSILLETGANSGRADGMTSNRQEVETPMFPGGGFYAQQQQHQLRGGRRVSSGRHKHSESLPSNLPSASSSLLNPPPAHTHAPSKPSPLRTSSLAASSSSSNSSGSSSNRGHSRRLSNSSTQARLSPTPPEEDTIGEELEMEDTSSVGEGRRRDEVEDIDNEGASMSVRGRALGIGLPMGVEPPEYRVVDPYKYAPGVAELMLQEMTISIPSTSSQPSTSHFASTSPPYSSILPIRSGSTTPNSTGAYEANTEDGRSLSEGSQPGNSGGNIFSNWGRSFGLGFSRGRGGGLSSLFSRQRTGTIVLEEDTDDSDSGSEPESGSEDEADIQRRRNDNGRN